MNHLEANTRKAFGLAGPNLYEQRVQKVIDKLILLGGMAKPEAIEVRLRKPFGSKRGCVFFLDQMVANGILHKILDSKEKFLILKTIPNFQTSSKS